MSDAPNLRGRLKFVEDPDTGEIFAPKLYGRSGIRLAEFADLPEPILFGQFLATQTPQCAAKLCADIFAFAGERANTTPFTSMLNTLFLREHNRLAGMLVGHNPNWKDEQVFQTARNINIVQLLNIVIEDYINHISSYRLKFLADPSVAWRAHWNRPNWISVEFNLLYRWHCMVPNEFSIGGQRVQVANALYNNSHFLNVGLAALAASASEDRACEVGLFNTAHFLLQQQLEARAIDQGRTNRIGTYNDYRKHFGFPQATRFEQITGDQNRVAQLQNLYGHADDVEFYVGLLAEDVPPRAAVPPLMGRMIAIDAFSHAFTNPLLCENLWDTEEARISTFTEAGLAWIKRSHRLEDIVNRNLAPGQEPVGVSMTWRVP